MSSRLDSRSWAERFIEAFGTPWWISDLSAMADEARNRTILVKIHSQMHPVNDLLIYHVFAEIGVVEDVRYMPTESGFHSLVRFRNKDGHDWAYHYYNRKILHQVCCELEVHRVSDIIRWNAQRVAEIKAAYLDSKAPVVMSDSNLHKQGLKNSVDLHQTEVMVKDVQKLEKDEQKMEKEPSDVVECQMFDGIPSSENCLELVGAALSVDTDVIMPDEFDPKPPMLTLTQKQDKLEVVDEHNDDNMSVSSDGDQENLKVCLVDESKDMTPCFDPGGEEVVAKELLQPVSHQLFEEMLEPNQEPKQLELKTFMVRDVRKATLLLLIRHESAELINSLNAFPKQEEIPTCYIGILCYDPGGGSWYPASIATTFLPCSETLRYLAVDFASGNGEFVYPRRNGDLWFANDELSEFTQWLKQSESDEGNGNSAETYMLNPKALMDVNKNGEIVIFDPGIEELMCSDLTLLSRNSWQNFMDTCFTMKPFDPGEYLVGYESGIYDHLAEVFITRPKPLTDASESGEMVFDPGGNDLKYATTINLARVYAFACVLNQSTLLSLECEISNNQVIKVSCLGKLLFDPGGNLACALPQKRSIDYGLSFCYRLKPAKQIDLNVFIAPTNAKALLDVVAQLLRKIIRGVLKAMKASLISRGVPINFKGIWNWYEEVFAVIELLRDLESHQFMIVMSSLAKNVWAAMLLEASLVDFAGKKDNFTEIVLTQAYILLALSSAATNSEPGSIAWLQHVAPEEFFEKARSEHIGNCLSFPGEGSRAVAFGFAMNQSTLLAFESVVAAVKSYIQLAVLVNTKAWQEDQIRCFLSLNPKASHVSPVHVTWVYGCFSRLIMVAQLLKLQMLLRAYCCCTIMIVICPLVLSCKGCCYISKSIILIFIFDPGGEDFEFISQATWFMLEIYLRAFIILEDKDFLKKGDL